LLNTRWQEWRRDRRVFRQGTVARGRIADGAVIAHTDRARVGYVVRGRNSAIVRFAQRCWRGAWLATLNQLPAYAGLQTSPATPVMSPANRGELAKLRTANEGRNADPLENELGRLFLAAAKEGIAFSLNTPSDSEQLRQTIESAPREKAGSVTYSR
jgi:hypothetical protein